MFVNKLYESKSFTEFIQSSYQKRDKYLDVYFSKGIRYYTKNRQTPEFYFVCMLLDLKPIKMDGIRRVEQQANISSYAISISLLLLWFYFNIQSAEKLWHYL